MLEKRELLAGSILLMTIVVQHDNCDRIFEDRSPSQSAEYIALVHTDVCSGSWASQTLVLGGVSLHNSRTGTNLQVLSIDEGPNESDRPSVIWDSPDSITIYVSHLPSVGMFRDRFEAIEVKVRER